VSSFSPLPGANPLSGIPSPNPSFRVVSQCPPPERGALPKAFLIPNQNFKPGQRLYGIPVEVLQCSNQAGSSFFLQNDPKQKFMMVG
jgi:hypothetical protein